MRHFSTAMLFLCFSAGMTRADAVDDRIEAAAKSMGGYNGVERDASRAGKPVITIKMQNAKAISPDVCKLVAQAKSVQKLYFTGSPLTDECVRELIPLAKTVRFLDLGGTKITSESLKHVAQFTNVDTLSLADTKVGNENLGELQKMKKLTHLHLSRTRVTADACSDLAGLKTLRELHLVEMRFKNEVIDDLRKKLPMTRIVR